MTPAEAPPTSPLPVRVFSTLPSSDSCDPTRFLDLVVDAAQVAEAAGCVGGLVYADNSLVDPWLVAQVAIAHTGSFVPLVAVQPVYAHPYTIANLISSLANLYGRRVALNMIAGGHANDLRALCDPTPHDDRYRRLTEYTQIVMALLTESRAVTYEGEFYSVTNLRLVPPMPPELVPEVFVSGSSPAGRATAQTLGATVVEYPEPVDAYEPSSTRERVAAGTRIGMRIGMIVSHDDETAWSEARRRYPTDRAGAIRHKLAASTSDSHWHRRLSELAPSLPESPYWLGPFESSLSMCPYLVGGPDTVAEHVARYLDLGFGSLLLDLADPDDLRAAMGVIADAAQRSGAHAPVRSMTPRT